MANQQELEKLLPLTEATFYIMLSLDKPLHGYGIMQNVATLSDGRVNLGPGTLYGALGKLEKSNMIEKVAGDEQDRRKNYVLTATGRDVVKLEYERLRLLVACSQPIVEKMEV